MKNIFGIAGQIGSGKSSAAKVATKFLHCTSLSFGGMIEEILRKENVEIDRDHLQDKGLKIINEIGYTGIAQLLLDTYSYNNRNSYVIEGIRHEDVSEYYKKLFNGFYFLIYIDCPIEERFRRIKGKNYKGIVINALDDLRKIESHPVEQNTTTLKRIADIQIENIGSLESLKEMIINNIRNL